MSLVFFTGWETGDTTEAFSTANATISSSTVRTGGYALRCNSSGIASYFEVPSITNKGALTNVGAFGGTSFYARFYFRYATKPLGGFESIARWYSNNGSGTDYICEAVLNSNGTVGLWNGSTVTSGSTVLSANTWYQIGFKRTITGQEIKVNGISEATLGMALGSSAIAFFLGQYVSHSGQSVDFFYDDLSIDSSAYPPDGAVKILLPTGVGTDNNWTGTYTNVSEVPQNGDTTRMNVTSSGAPGSPNFSSPQTFTFQSTSTAGITGVINGVKIHHYSRGGNASLAIGTRIRSGGTTSDVTTNGQTVGTSYLTSQKIAETDPNTGSAWTSSAVDSVQGGPVPGVGGNPYFCTACYAMVDYTPPATYTSAIALTLNHPTITATGTRTAPTYSGSASLALKHPTVSETGTFTVPVYHGTGSLSLKHPTITDTGTFVPPTYHGAASLALKHPTIGEVGTFVSNIYTSNIALSLKHPTISNVGAFVRPIYSGSASLSLKHPTISEAGVFAAQLYQGSGSLSLRHPTISETGIYIPIYIGTGALSLKHPTISGGGAIPQTYVGMGSLTLPHLSVSNVGNSTLLGILNLFVQGGYPSVYASIPLVLWNEYQSVSRRIPLYIRGAGRNPGFTPLNATLNLFVEGGTGAPSSIPGSIEVSIPLFVSGKIPTVYSTNNSIPLFIRAPYPIITGTIPLYISGLAPTSLNGSIPLSIPHVSITSSIPLYIHGF